MWDRGPEQQQCGNAYPLQIPTQKKKPNWVFRIALAVFLACAVALAAIGVSYWLGQNKYDKASESALVVNDTKASLLADMAVDWNALRAINPDTIAWIVVPGTEINYPIVRTSNNDVYIKTDFYGETNWFVSYGALFLDEACSADFKDQNSFVYGHNMENGAMFAAIAGFEDDAVFNDHRTVYLLTPKGNMRLTTFALDHVAADDALVQPNVGTASELQGYLQDKLDRSVVQPKGMFPSLKDIAKTFVFITCDNLPSDGRFVLYCYVAESTYPGIDGIE